MDARITKQRLANMLSYDWLKILGVIALAAVLFSVFFLMIATRPTAGQCFYIYAYDGISAGEHFNAIGDDMKDKGVFSYDILDTGSEAFSSGGIYGNSAFTARRSAGEGRVMFVNDVRTTDENGNQSSTLLSFIENRNTPYESFPYFLDPEVFMNDCESYLKNFFGDDLSAEEPAEKETRDAFTARNGKDKRYRSSAKKEAGVLEEVKRLKKLKKDFLTVKAAFGEKLGLVEYTGFEGKVHKVAFSMKSLNLTPLVYYNTDEGKKNGEIALCIFNNGKSEGDLKYETVNFLAYLLERYGNNGTAQ